MTLPQLGNHRARATEALLGRAGTGTNQIAVRFAVLTPDGSESTGEEITWYGYLTDSTFARTVESLRHCGWQGDDLSDLSTVGSQDCEIVVGEDEYQGQMRIKVQWVNALGGGGGIRMADQLSPEEAKAFGAKMRGKVIAATKKTPTSAAAPTKPAPARAAKTAAPTAPAQHPNAPGQNTDAPPIDELGF